MESNMSEYKRSFGKEVIISLERNDYISYLRNRLLAEEFYLTGEIEKYGTGFNRTHEALRDYHNEEFVYSEKVVFSRAELRVKAPTTPTISDKRGGIHSDLENRMILLIKENTRISYKDLAAKLGISRDTAIEYMSRLKKNGVASRFGTTREGYCTSIQQEAHHEHSWT